MSSSFAVLFDFDGTLCNNFDEALCILNMLADEFGFKKVTNAEVARQMSNEELIRSLEVPVYKLPVLLRKGRQLMQKRIPSFRAVEGMPDLLHSLWERKIRTGILSSNSQKNILLFLKANKLSSFNYFSTGLSMFGKARQIQRLLKSKRCSLQNSFYVGDETRDIDAAKKARVKSVAVSWGYHSIEALRKKNPDYLLTHPLDFLSLI